MSKVLKSIYRKLWCFFICMQKLNLFTSFLKYYILKNPTIWLADSVLVHNSRTRIFPDMGWNIGGEISIATLIFILFYFQQKLITIFSKNPKRPWFGDILGTFCPNLGRNEFSWRKGPWQFLNIHTIVQNRRKN